MYNLETVQNQIIAHLKSSTTSEVHEVAIPDPETLKRNSKGEIYPYVAFQIQMPQFARGESFAGVWSADYDLPVNIQAVGPTADISRRLANIIYGAMLGFGINFGSGFRPRFGGSVMPVTSNDGTVQAYIHPMSFSARVELFKTP